MNDNRRKWSIYHEKCILCERTDIKHKAKGYCSRCYQISHDYPKEYCSICNNLKRVHKRDNNKPICRSCYSLPMYECFLCNKITVSALKISDKEHVCHNCYNKYYRKKHQCTICGCLEIAAIHNDNEIICKNCYSNPAFTCGKCGRFIKSPYLYNGKHICNRCYDSFRKKLNSSKIDITHNHYSCIICSKENNIQRIYNDGSIICETCYEHLSKICMSCKDVNSTIYSYIKALPYCRQCFFREKYSLFLESLKVECSESYLCILDDYFNSKSLFFSTETIYNSIKNSTDLFSYLYVIYKNNKFSFNNLDFFTIYKKFPNKTIAINDFINFLNDIGSLADYDMNIKLLGQLEVIIDTLPIDLRKLAISYKNWLIKKYNNYKSKGWIGKHSKFSYYTCYLYLLTALRFFVTLSTEFDIKQSTQIHNQVIDSYLKLKPYDKGNIRHLIKYINSINATFSHITLPHANYKHELYTGLSLNKQNVLIEKLLFNESINIRDRALLLLMLLFGYTPREIQNLKIIDFIIKDFKLKSKILLIRNNIQYKISEPVTSIIFEYIGSLSKDVIYAFPGRYLNRPLSLSSICKILNHLNVTSRELYYSAVNNSMLNGIYQPSLLMKMYEIHFTTATRYFNLIKNPFDQ